MTAVAASMKVGVENQKLMKPCSYTLKIISLYLVIVAGTASAQNISQNIRCPFEYLYHFGDSTTDVGNSIREDPTIPAARMPYGRTFPGTPTGRWSDGRIDIDYTASDLGLPNITAYLALNQSAGSYDGDGVIFSVANSPVLNLTYFSSRGVTFPPYASPLSLQISWFRTYLSSVCTNPTDCARITSSLIVFGDIEANDIGYSLVQGKSIAEVRSYVPDITQAQINAGRELIRLGATRIAFTGSAPLGCYPYILTALPSTNPLDYDGLGCLKSVNDLIISKNSDLLLAVVNLKLEFPNVTILYGDYYTPAELVITQTSVLGVVRGNVALKACCGIGGRYNYDSRRFCGSPGVPVCTRPEEYISWDGMHFTQEAYRKIERLLVRPLLPVLGCTIQL